MRFGSLFTGIGGMDLGFERAGLRCAFQVEIEPYNLAVLDKRFPSVPKYKDVTKFCRRVYDCEPEDSEGFVRCPRCDAEFGECECVGTDQLLDETGGGHRHPVWWRPVPREQQRPTRIGNDKPVSWR